jgi:hypothetical protein
MPAKYTPLELDKMTTEELVRAIGEAWYNNDMDTFLSLFAPGATIKHPLFPNPITPEIAADVLNVGVRKTGLLAEPQAERIKTPEILKAKAGEADEDVVEMRFLEAKPGIKLSKNVEHTSSHTASMQVRGHVRRRRFVHLDVHGYAVS